MASSFWSLGSSIIVLAVAGCDAQHLGGESAENEEQTPPENDSLVVELTLNAPVEGHHLTVQCDDLIEEDDEPIAYFLSDPEYDVLPERKLRVHVREEGVISECLNNFSSEDQDSRIAVMWIGQHHCGMAPKTAFTNEVLIYSETAISAESRVGRFVGRQLSPGIHVFEVVQCDDEAVVSGLCLKYTESKVLHFTTSGPTSPSTAPPKLHLD